MAKLPLYEQQTLPQGGRADASMMGAATGQAMAQAGSVLADIGVTMKRREDVIDRTIRARDFDQFANEALTALETQDLARKDTIDQYSQGLRAKMDELMAGHAGTASSKAEFRNQLENQVAQYERGARAAQVKAQHTLLGNMIEQRTNALAVDAGFAPDMMDEIFNQLDADISQFSDALPADMIQKYKDSGRSAIAAASISQLESQGNFAAAKALLQNPNVSKFLNPDATRRFTISITAGQAKQDREAAQREANVQSWAMAMGIDAAQLTPQQRMIAENASPQTMQLTEKINLATMMNGGQPLTLAQRNQIIGLDKQGSRTQMQDLLADLPAFESGRMTDVDRAAFLLQAEKLFPTQYRLNQDSGQYEAVPGSGGVAKLSQTLGRPVSAGGPRRSAAPAAPAAPVGGTPAGAGMDMGVDNSFVDAQGRTDFMALPPQPGDANYQADAVFEGAEQQAFDELMQGGGLWNMAEQVAGPVAGARRAIGGGPVDVGVGQQEVAAARRTELIQRRLVSALQQNPRYAEGERQDIAKSITIEPAVMSNPTAYRTRLIQIGKYLQEEIAFNTNVLKQDPTKTTVQMRQQAMQAIPLMQKVYEVLQLPPTVKTPEEALKMQPRPRQVLTPDGRLLNVPQE
jgi:hypothetical protein